VADPCRLNSSLSRECYVLRRRVRIRLTAPSRVFSTSAETTLSGLEIKRGKTTGLFEGGAGIDATAPLTIVDSVIRDNQTTGNQASGAGISASDTLTVTGSMVVGNSTTGTLSIGGGIFAVGEATLSNSTIANNSTTGSQSLGGGIFSATTVTLTNVTVARNSTKTTFADGGGIYGDEVILANSTVTGNSTAGDGAQGGGIFAGTIITANNSLILGNVTSFPGVGGDEGSAPTIVTNGIFGGGGATSIFYANSDVIDANGVNTGVKAGVVGDWGGPVNTIGLLPDPSNPALDRGDSDSTSADARGQVTYDFPSIPDSNGNARDLGAFEVDYDFASLAPGAETRSLVVTILGDVLDPYDNETSLREAIAFSNDPAAGGSGDADGVNGAIDTITFDPTLSGGKITLALGQLLATAPVTIDGDIDNDNAPDITIDAHQASRVIQLTGLGTLRGLILENGKTTGINEFGGAVRATTLTIEDSIVRNSSTTDGNAHGGGVYSNSSLTLLRSTVTGNSTNGDNATGGGVVGNTVTLTQSTISGNSTTKSGANGGGVFASTLNATDSTISGNSTEGQFAQGGGAFAFTATLTNTTVSGNSTIAFGAHGGGISSQDLTLTNTTVTGNSIAGTSPRGGGVYVAGPVKVFNSLIVGNVKSDGVATDNNLFGTTTVTNSNSLIAGNATLFFATTANVIDGNGVDTGIKGGVLADNGGPVQTVALLPVVANPALDAGNDALDPATDARGQARVNVPGVANNGANISDLGAFEVINVAPFVANAIPDQSSLEDLLWTFTFAANAFADPESVALTYTATLANDAPLPSWLTFNGATRTFSGTPPLNFFGVFDIKVTASDGSLSVSDVFRLTIVDVVDNYAPDAVDDTVAAQFNAPTNYTSAQLLANDSDPENNPFRLIAVFNAIGGSVSANDAGVVTFTPVTGFSGQASFRYAIGDSFGGSDSATVTVNVAGPPSPPVTPTTPDPHAPVAPSSNAVWTVANFASPKVVIGASDPDGDIVSYAVKPGSGPTKGSVSFVGDTFVYLPVSGAQGSDAFTIRISDAGGRFADQVVNVAIVPVPTPSDWLYLADDGERVTLGGKGQVFATTDVQEITVVPVPGMLSLDGSFNAGGDVVRLSGVAAQWQAAVSGSGAILTDGATFVQIPAGPAGLALVFEDGMRSLKIDTATSSIRIGSQAITENYAPLTAPAQALSLPTGFDTSAHGVLLMDEQGTAIVKGTMQVFGTPADGERIVMLGGTIGFDGSFNGGGDTIVFPGPAASFSAQVQASAVVVARTGLSAQIPFGLESTTLAFTDAAHPLYFDGASSVFIGDQTISSTSALLTFA